MSPQVAPATAPRLSKPPLSTILSRFRVASDACLLPCCDPHRNPEAMTADASKFQLDLGFNRYGTQQDDGRNFACDIDPLAIADEELTRPSAPLIRQGRSKREWRSYFVTHFEKWSFAVRTDPPRGLTWGPYATLRHPLPGEAIFPSLQPCAVRGLEQSFEAAILSEEDSLELPQRKPVGIIAILKPPVVISIKLNSRQAILAHLDEFPNDEVLARLRPRKRLRPQDLGTIDEEEPVDEVVSRRKRTRKAPIPQVVLSTSEPTAPARPRIVLCAASTLKYCT